MLPFSCAQAIIQRAKMLYITSPYSGAEAGEIDMAEVERHILFMPSYLCTGILPDPRLESDAGGCGSFVHTMEFDRDSILDA